MIGIRYSDNDFETIKKHLLSRIPYLTQNWSDYNESDPGIVLIDAMARLADLLSYRRDREAAEANFATVRQRKNLKGLLKLINYYMYEVAANNISVLISLINDLDKSVIIPAYSKFYTILDNGKYRYFSNLTDIYLNPGNYTFTTIMHQGEPEVVDFTLRDILDSGYLYLQDEDIAENTLFVASRSALSTESEITVWTKVDDLALSTAADPVYIFDTDKDGVPFIRFGSLYKTLFDDSTQIEVSYLISEGLSGTVPKDTILYIASDIFDREGNVFDTLSYFTFSTITSASGGRDKESFEHAKKYAPFSIKSMNALVSTNDYTVKVSSFPSVEQAIALDWNVENSGIIRPYYVRIYVVPKEGMEVDSQFITNLTEYIDTSNKLSTIEFSIQEAEYVDCNITINLYIKGNSQFKDRAYMAVYDATINYFKASNLEFGKPVYLSALMSDLVKRDSEIIYLTISGLPEVNETETSVSMKPYEICRLGEFTLNLKEIS